VAKPGPLRIRAGSTVLQALAEAGDIVGVREDLAATLMRGETRIVVDLRKALLTPTANPVLQDGDVLFVQPVPKLGIVVAGAVKNPGAYRLPQGCTVVDALAAAADVSVRPERARITLVRNGARQAVTWGSARTPLQDADIILVEQEPVLRVYLNGQVKLPGAYELPEGSGVLQALALAGGATDAAALDNVTIVRAATNTQEKVSLTAALSGLQGANPVLQSGDQIIVPTSTASVAIFGNVARPGQYPISPFAPMRITDAVAQAGSMDKDSNPAGTMIIRVVEGKTQLIPADMSNLIKMARVTLMPGDIVYVPKAGNKTNWRDVLDSLYRVGVLVSVL
jgi:protein involved in polysaccharide export with SLBB domain